MKLTHFRGYGSGVETDSRGGGDINKYVEVFFGSDQYG